MVLVLVRREAVLPSPLRLLVPVVPMLAVWTVCLAGRGARHAPGRQWWFPRTGALDGRRAGC